MSILDNSIDDILWIKLENANKDEASIIICSCYLSPEGSTRGNNEQEFFEKLTESIHNYTDEDTIIICGDFNSRIGKEQDIKDKDLPRRNPIDNTINQHGRSLLNFLNDNNLCILNGRLTTSNDNFTSTGRGKAVVDYQITSIESLYDFSEAKVATVSELITDLKINQYSETTKLPDHSFLTCKLDTTHKEIKTTNQTEENIVWNDTKITKFKLKNLTPALMETNELKSIIETSIKENVKNPEMSEVNYTNTINNLREFFKNEIGIKTNSKTAHSQHMKHQKGFWDEKLEEEWKEVGIAEKNFLKCKGNHQAQTTMRLVFLNKRKVFNQTIRRAKRKANAERRENIELYNKTNPKEFWSKINELGPQKFKKSDFRTNKEDGSLETNPTKIKKKWKEEFSGLYNTEINNNPNTQNITIPQLIAPADEQPEEQIDGKWFVNKKKDKLKKIHPNWLNKNISIEEVQWATSKAKNGKAGGVDQMPNELWKNNNFTLLLHTMFQQYFLSGETPSEWKKSIITPLLKPGKDKNEPLSYRGISLMPTIAKIFTSIINNRLKQYLESNSLLCDEQNGFRENRSCLDHIFSVSTILRNRLSNKKDTFTCFVDFAKAFDSVNHKILWSILQANGLHGNIFITIQNMYNDLQAAVSLDDHLTDWFSIKGGVRQGDNLAPTLFAMYINSLTSCVNAQNEGINFDDNKLSILLYADDIVLLAESEKGLQKLLDTTSNWITQHKMSANMDKTKIIHFRTKKKKITNYQFTLCNNTIDFTAEYKYLGLTLHEHLNYTFSTEKLTTSAGKALGAITAKYLKAKGLHFKTFSKIYEATVLPIMLYASQVWGKKLYQKQEDIHHRAMRTFLGVGKKTPIPALYGETGWHKLATHKAKDCISYWLKLFNMDNNRLTKKIFIWDYKKALLGQNCWNKEIKEILTTIDMEDTFYGINVENIGKIKHDSHAKLVELEKASILEEINIMPKLRTYKTLLRNFGTPAYIKSRIEKSQRSTITKLRVGVYPINIETGRHRKEKLEERTCPACINTIEDEEHFLVTCPLYNETRQNLYNYFKNNIDVDITNLNEHERLVTMLDNPKTAAKTANFVKQAYNIRFNFIKHN